MYFNYISDTVPEEVLQPLAVIPIEQPDPAHSGDLQSFANQVNAPLVYACDEFGNQIAVGVFVTDSFGQIQDKKAEFGEVKVDGNPNPNWVGAVEECCSAENEIVSVEEEMEGPSKPLIRVYKVN